MNNVTEHYKDLPVVLNVSEVAEILGICKKVAYNMAKKENLAIRVGEKRLVIPRDRFIAFLNRGNNLFEEG